MSAPRDNLQFFNPWAESDFSRNRLPHWQQSGAVYFVTWRLADSIPKEKQDEHFDEIAMWRAHHPEPWDDETEEEYHRRFSTRIDEWMDAGYGSCLLRDSGHAEIIKNVLLYFESERTAMLSFVIMPNHVHALFALKDEWKLETILHSWKRNSSVQINRQGGSEGTPLWQKDYFDRLIRDERHFENCVRYIRRNPEKAKLQPGEYILWESAITQSIE
jgi:REP element-mobilizing transposase RayT